MTFSLKKTDNSKQHIKLRVTARNVSDYSVISQKDTVSKLRTKIDLKFQSGFIREFYRILID